MKTRFASIAVACAIALTSLTHAQDITPEQALAIKHYEDPQLSVTSKASLGSRVAPTTKVQPPLPQFAPQFKLSDADRKALALKRKALERTAALTATVSEPLAMSGSSGDSFMADQNGTLLNFGTCGANQYQFYDLPAFNGTLNGLPWYVEDVYNDARLWSLSSLPQGPDGSYNTAQSPNFNTLNYSESDIYHHISNHYDLYGDALNHRVTFFYVYSPYNGNDVFRLSLFGSFFSANLPPTTNDWQRISFVVPPDKIATDTTGEIRFSLYKQDSNILGPFARLAYVQICPEIRPAATPLVVNHVGTNVVIQWNASAQPTNFWKLVASPILTSTNTPWGTNALSVVVSNNLAVAIFPATNSAFFYELKHR